MVVFLHNHGTAHAVILTAKMKLAAHAPSLTDTELNSGVVDKQMSVVNEKSNRHVGYWAALKSANAAAASTSQARMEGISAGNPDVIK